MAIARPRAGLTGIPDNVWPIVASMFMFRMIIYLYELKHAKRPEPLGDTLGYFFLLPNYASYSSRWSITGRCSGATSPRTSTRPSDAGSR